MLVSLLANGCASLPAPPLKPGVSAASLDARSLDDPQLLAFLAASGATKPVARRWDLRSLTLAAVYRHPDLEVADARLAVARAAARTAKQRANPIFNLTPQFNTSNANPTAWTIGTAITLLVDLFGKREARTAEAQALAEAAQFDVATASWQVRGRVRAALLNLWSAQLRVTFASERRDLQAHLSALVERRLAVGEVSALDLARERASRDTAVLAVTDAIRDVADARVMLATAVGISVLALDGVTLDFGSLNGARLPLDPVALRRAALTTRSDIQASLARYSAAQATVALQQANRLPGFAIGPGYQYDQGQNKFSLSVQSDLPLFNANGGPIGEAEAKRREASASFTALQAQIIGEIDRALAAYATATDSLAAADRLAAQQAERKERNARVFRAGALDRVTLLTGEIEFTGGRASQLQALVAQRSALGQLEDALHVPIFTPALPAAPGYDGMMR
ncbi:TolC family protein [Sphingomonas glacialis]|uniref:TolC family protein n=1 Tax=Sphingomonas glacialis TaxID=658225 RepID=UPI001678FC22|nr:TolC family protein [Sphingomonas glacialis]